MNRMIDIKYVLILIFQIACTNTYAQVESYVPAKKHIVRTEYVTREIIDTLEAERIFNEMRPALIENNHTDITSWDEWLLGEDEIPYKEITDTIIKEMDATENDVWDYIETHRSALVSDKTKDAAFITPTSMLTGRTWLLKKHYLNVWSSDYLEDEKPIDYGIGEGTGYICGKLVFKPNGTYNAVRVFHADGTNNEWEITYNGIWTRYKKEYICMKPNAASVKVRCIEYQGVPYQQLSERQQSNVKDKIVDSTKDIKKRMSDEQSPMLQYSSHRPYRNPNYVEYPNTKSRSLCERLDEYFLVLGKHIYVNKDKFYEVYEKSIK